MAYSSNFGVLVGISLLVCPSTPSLYPIVVGHKIFPLNKYVGQCTYTYV